MNRGNGLGDLAGHKDFAASRAFVIEQDAVRGMETIGFAIIHGNPIGIELRGGIGTARIERRRFALWSFLHLAVELGRRSLIKTYPIFQAQNSNTFKET